MTSKDDECFCPRCLHPTCPHPDAAPPYDQITHEIDNNILSVRIPKAQREFEPRQGQGHQGQQEQDNLGFDLNCVDAQGEKCINGHTKVNVIPDQQPPAKKPDEEMLSLKAIRQIMPNDNLKNALEIEFKAPRNYIPLPEPGPPPPIIVPKQRSRSRGKRKNKRGNKIRPAISEPKNKQVERDW